jgi:hypothetical protein
MISQKYTWIFLFMFLSVAANGQEAIAPSLSPAAIARIRYKDAYVKITYCQPHKRGREVFGKLVPYGQVWRLGANEATEITITRDMQVNGQLLRAGTYTLFSIPEKDKWTIIINSEPGLWGAYNYNAKLDVMRFDVPVKTITNPVYEAFQMKFDQKNEMANLLINWDNVQVSIPFKFTN